MAHDLRLLSMPMRPALRVSGMISTAIYRLLVVVLSVNNSGQGGPGLKTSEYLLLYPLRFCIKHGHVPMHKFLNMSQNFGEKFLKKFYFFCNV